MMKLATDCVTKPTIFLSTIVTAASVNTGAATDALATAFGDDAFVISAPSARCRAHAAPTARKAAFNLARSHEPVVDDARDASSSLDVTAATRVVVVVVPRLVRVSRRPAATRRVARGAATPAAMESAMTRVRTNGESMSGAPVVRRAVARRPSVVCGSRSSARAVCSRSRGHTFGES